MGNYTLELESVKYRGPDDYLDGKEKIVVLLENHNEFTDVESLYEQLSDTERLGKRSNNIEAEVEFVNDEKARLVYDPEEASDLDVRHFLEHEEDEE